MTDAEKIEQARALSDAGAFKRTVVERTPTDLYSDSCKLECGHTVQVPPGYDKWECRECRRVFEPQSTLRPLSLSSAARKTRSYYLFYGFSAFGLLYFIWLLAWAIPQWVKDGREREQDYQELKRRVTRLEQRLAQKP